MPDSKQLGSYRGLGNLWSSIKKKKKKLRQPGGFFLFEGRGRMEKGWGKERKINLQSSGTSQFLSLCTGGSMPPFQSARASRSAQAVWPCQRDSSLASAHPSSLSFSLKWQQWVYPVQGQCWSSWDVDCYSKTCTLDWVQRAAG